MDRGRNSGAEVATLKPVTDRLHGIGRLVAALCLEIDGPTQRGMFLTQRARRCPIAPMQKGKVSRATFMTWHSGAHEAASGQQSSRSGGAREAEQVESLTE
jgi:hypothetical protein